MILLRLLLGLAVFAPRGLQGGLTVEGLRCEYRVNPLGIGTPQPRLSWVLNSRQRGQYQTAYQILAATTPGQLARNQADLWDSGKLNSSESLHIAYAGKPLNSGQRVYWKIRAWDRERRPSDFSSVAWWEMALLSPQDWRAS
jgi:alpha-L-rhamnosidase